MDLPLFGASIRIQTEISLGENQVAYR